MRCVATQQVIEESESTLNNTVLYVTFEIRCEHAHIRVHAQLFSVRVRLSSTLPLFLLSTQR